MNFNPTDFYTEFNGDTHVYAIVVSPKGTRITFGFDENVFHPAKERTLLKGFHAPTTLMRYIKTLEEKYDPLLSQLSSDYEVYLVPHENDAVSFPGYQTRTLEDYV